MRILLMLAIFGLWTVSARAADAAAFSLTLQDHKFTPTQLTVPAGQPVVITIDNRDPLAEEFDSSELHVEKVVAGKSQGTVHLHALTPGTYHFTGEYHSDTAQGAVVVK